MIKSVLIPSLRTDVRMNWQSWNSDGTKIAKGSGWGLSHICVTGAWSRPQHLQRCLNFSSYSLLLIQFLLSSGPFSLNSDVQQLKPAVLYPEGQLGQKVPFRSKQKSCKYCQFPCLSHRATLEPNCFHL